jgi:hypothetical protein
MILWDVHVFQEAIAEAMGLALDIVIADARFSCDFDPNAIFEIAQVNAHEADQTCETALRFLSQKQLIDGVEWPGFDYIHLLNFCAVQFVDDVPFDRKLGAAQVVFAVAEVLGARLFSGRTELITSACEIAGSALPSLLSSWMSLSSRVLAELPPNDTSVPAISRYFLSLNLLGVPDQQARRRAIIAS